MPRAARAKLSLILGWLTSCLHTQMSPVSGSMAETIMVLMLSPALLPPFIASISLSVHVRVPPHAKVPRAWPLKFDSVMNFTSALFGLAPAGNFTSSGTIQTQFGTLGVHGCPFI